MTRTIYLLLAFLFAFVQYSSAKNIAEDPQPVSTTITTLVINANVTVYLVGSDEATLQVNGNEVFSRLVSVQRKGDTLVINAAKNKNLKGAGAIYVPAGSLQKIDINNDAFVKSVSFLRIPLLEVLVNGACKVDIANVGNLNFFGSPNYLVRKWSEASYPIPASVLRALKEGTPATKSNSF
jgi:hypothetical protein